MDKKQMSEQDIRTKFITPAIEAGGWDVRTRVREEVTFTAGRVIVRGRLPEPSHVAKELLSSLQVNLPPMLPRPKVVLGTKRKLPIRRKKI
jgi:type I restriction enzyme, R subunit